VFFILLPLLGFIATYLFVSCLLQRKNLQQGWAQALLLAAVGWQIWLVVTTEVLSFFKLLNVSGLALSWLGYIILLLGIAYFLGFQLPELHLPHLYSSSLFLKLIIGCIGLIIVITGLVAFISPPNNIDSMVYHMSRVAHWLQNQSVAHYAACNSSQNHQNPGAEFALVQLQILSGTDRFANVVQWLSMVGCIIGGSFIARLLGANPTGQILTALIVATIPIGVLQAVTTQNDYVVAFWLVCFTAFILQLRERWSWLFLLGAAGSLALAVLTKATAYLFALPLAIWLGWHLLKTTGWRAWQPMLVILIIVVAVNSGHFYRNFQLFASPLGPGREGTVSGFEYANQTFTLGTVISNLIRNLVLHIYLPSPLIQKQVQAEVRQFHDWLGLSPDNPQTTWGGTPFEIPGFRVDENVTGNFIHFLLIILSSVVILVRQVRHRAGLLTVYICLLIGAFGLFAFYLKWQPWHSRLHLPLFVLWAPVIGIFLSQFGFLTIQRALVIGLIIQVWPFILFNPLHPVIGPKNIFNMSRLEQQFLINPASLEPYRQAAQVIHENQCYQVGLSASPGVLEYPIWSVLQAESDKLTQLHCLDIKNESASLSSDKLPLCAVICLTCPDSQQKFYQATMGSPVLSYGNNILFIQPMSSLSD
jgi:hypothetical protein